MMIAPSEPAALRALGRTTLLPERYGVDLLFASPAAGLVGLQRKVFPGDFLSSIEDARLSMQISQMSLSPLKVKVLLLEGRGTWTTEGELVAKYGSWDKSKHRRFLLSVQAAGVQVHQTDSLDDTISFVRDLEVWADKWSHRSMRTTRTAVKRDAWGRAGTRQFQLHLIQGVPNVGPELAERILDTLGFPFGLTVSENQLLQVEGIGPKKARQILNAFEASD